jgi:hypothetical protein
MGKSDELAKGFSLPQALPRTEVSDEQALRFVQGGQEPSPRRAKRLKRSSRLRREESGERVAVYLPPEAAMALRVRCAQERRSVSDAVTEAVAKWLKSSGAKSL